MSTGRIVAILLALLAGFATVAGNDGARARAAESQLLAQQSTEQVIAPSMALRIALRYSPGSQGLDVTLVEGGRPAYAVKLKTGNRVHRVLVDALTGQILGE
jgi:uncharacterized membrane protein YkoI